VSLYVWLVLTALRIAWHLDGFVVQVLFIPFGSLLLFRILGFAGIDLFATLGAERARRARDDVKLGSTDHLMPRMNPRPSALDRLCVFIGRWLTEGETVATPERPSVKISASDVYEWGPGGQFIMHPAYGRIEEQDVGGLEVIGYDPATDSSAPSSLTTRGT